MIKKVMLVLFCSVMVLFTGRAFAGFDKLSEDGLPNTASLRTWEDIDQRNNATILMYCKSMNDQFNTNIPCTIDHKSFVDHYASDFKNMSKIDDRDGTDPSTYCATSGVVFFGKQLSATTQGASWNCAKDDECAKAFREQIKSIVCKYDDNIPKPKLDLKEGVLTLTVTAGKGKDRGYTTNGDAWVEQEFKKVFPPYKKVWDSRH